MHHFLTAVTTIMTVHYTLQHAYPSHPLTTGCSLKLNFFCSLLFVSSFVAVTINYLIYLLTASF